MADEPLTPPPSPDTVPYGRFQEVVSARNTATTRIEALEAELQGLSEKAATVDTLGTQLNETKAALEKANGRFGRFKTIAGALGTADEEAVEAAEWAYSRLPEEGRPELPDWLNGIKEKPETAPKVLQSWMQGSGETQQTTTPTPKPAPRPPPRGPTPPTAPQTVTAAQIREARDYAVKTGDWSRYKALAEAGGYRRKSG